MEKIKNVSGKAWRKTKELYKKCPSVRFLVVLLSVLVFYCIMYGCFGGYFMTNDDSGMMATVSGFGSGKPSSYHYFIFTPLGMLYKWLYTLQPYISWYSLFHIGSMILCISVFIFEIFKQNTCKNPRLRCCVAVFSLFCMTTFLIYPFYNLSWTLTAAMYGVAAVMMTLSLEFSEVNKHFIIKYAIVMVFLMMSRIVRDDSYTAILPFFIISFSYVVFQCRKKWKKFFTVGIVLTTAVILALFPNLSKADAKYKESVAETDSYSELKKYRARFSDYPILPFKGNEEFYESMGWDEEFFDLSREWMYFDRRFNAENLKKIVEASHFETETVPFNKKIKNTFVVLKGWGSKLCILQFTCTIGMGIIATGSAVLFFVIRRKKNRHISELLLLAGVNGLAVAEILYLCYMDRFLYRSFMCAAIPAFCIDGLIFLKALSWFLDHINEYYVEISMKNKTVPQTVSRKKIGRVGSYLMAVCLLAGFYATLNMSNYTFAGEKVIEQKANAVNYTLLTRYYATHSDQLFIHPGITLTYSPLFPDEEFRGVGNNAAFWGGTDVFTKNWYKFFNGFGYKEFFMDNLLDENVYLIWRRANMQDSTFLAYMRKAYGDDIQCYYVDTIFEGAYVFKFFRPQNDKKIFSEDLMKDNLYFLSDNDNMNNSEFAAYVRAEYGNGVGCNCIKTFDEKTVDGKTVGEKMYLYKIVKDFGKEITVDTILDDDIYFLSQGSDPDESEEMQYVKENSGDDIDCVLTDKVNDNLSVYKFIK